MSIKRKILFFAVNPKDKIKLRLDEEVRDIIQGIHLINRSQFDTDQIWAVRPQDLRRTLLNTSSEIDYYVHFCGHADLEGLILEDENGESIFVKPDALAELFELFTDRIKCVFFNACYSQQQAEAVSQFINYVIGMRQPIEDKAAKEFAVSFYDGLAGDLPIEQAYKLGCNALKMKNTPEHLVPVLITKVDVSSDVNQLLSVQGILDISTQLNKLIKAPDLKIGNSIYAQDLLQQLTAQLEELVILDASVIQNEDSVRLYLSRLKGVTKMLRKLVNDLDSIVRPQYDFDTNLRQQARKLAEIASFFEQHGLKSQTKVIQFLPPKSQPSLKGGKPSKGKILPLISPTSKPSNENLETGNSKE